MKWIVYTIKKWATMFANWLGRVFHRKGNDPIWNDRFNYVHPYDPFYQSLMKRKAKKKSIEVKLDEYEISAYHDGN
jgi:hypothetical protein